MNRTRRGIFFVGLAVGAGVGGAAACSSEDRVAGGGRVEHPVEPSPSAAHRPAKAPPEPTLVLPETSATAPVSSAPAVERSLSLSERFEENTGMKLSPLEKAIMNECPDRRWSKSVPNRRCARDGECGDGFCNRGRCTAIWTCGYNYGQRCESDNHCDSGPCVDGRCSSCASDAECVKQSGDGGAKCQPNVKIPGTRECQHDYPSKLGAISRPPQQDAGP